METMHGMFSNLVSHGINLICRVRTFLMNTKLKMKMKKLTSVNKRPEKATTPKDLMKF